MTSVLNPVWRPWRSLRARALAPLGRGEEALSLVAGELALARRWGTPALVGTTLRCLGENQAEMPGEQAVPTLREAVEVLSTSPRRLEEARALTSLGRALLASVGSRDDARACLQRALDLAGQCAARGLRSELADLLRSLGVVAPVEVDPRYELTAAERRSWPGPPKAWHRARSPRRCSDQPHGARDRRVGQPAAGRVCARQLRHDLVTTAPADRVAPRPAGDPASRSNPTT